MVDVVRQPPQRNKYFTARNVALGVAAITVIVGVGKLRPAMPEIDASSVLIDTVRFGVFTRDVRAAGTLVPENIQWVSALSPGRVESIAVAPGQRVARGAFIMRLTNPDVTLQVLEAQRQLGAAESGLVSLKASLQTQALTQQSTLATLRSTEADAARQARAKEELLRSSVVAAMEVEVARDHAIELKERLAIELERRKAFAEAARAQIDVQRAEIARLKSIVAFQQSRADALDVRSPINGVVQDIPHEPGQWVNPGAVLAKVVAPERLKAVLRVPEGEANGLALGQPVSIDMRTGVVAGVISRIDAGVQNGVVRVDVRLPDQLPAGARPDLTIDGTIQLDRASNVLYVGRPPHAQPQGVAQVFKVNKTGSEAERISMRTGRVSATTMEVLNGLSRGDVVLMVDPQDIDASRIRIKRERS